MQKAIYFQCCFIMMLLFNAGNDCHGAPCHKQPGSSLPLATELTTVRTLARV
jgi:hypothetical protein